MSNVTDPLTEREQDVLQRMVRGLTNRQIADDLVIEYETVRWYTKQIYSKLGVHSRIQAIKRAEALLKASPVTGAAPTVHHNLPHYPTSFVGREREMEELMALLENPDVRLITVTGTGGIGKTRLCVEVAHRIAELFDDGIVYVPLASLDSTDTVVAAVASALNMRASGEASPVEHLIDVLKHMKLLLVMDNYEHLLERSPIIHLIIQNTNEVKVLATSRVALNISGEWVRYLDGIAFPNQLDDADVLAYGAVALLVDRARQVRPDFAVDGNEGCMVTLCRMVQGMPLAIELAASWLKMLSCQDIVTEIGQNIDFLATNRRDVDERHRSIRAVFDYSWEMLSVEEQKCFQRLAVFRGGFGREAAERIGGASLDILSKLMDKSFLYQNERGLFETHDLLRQYAEEKLKTTSEQSLSTRSSILLSWSSLVQGDFERAHELADAVMSKTMFEVAPQDTASGLALAGILAGMKNDYDYCQQLCDASLYLITDAHKDPINSTLAHLGIAVAACGLDDYPAARYHIRSALSFASAINVPAFLTLCLPVAGVVLAHEVDLEMTIEVFALAFTHRASTPSWVEQWSLLTNLQHDLQAELGEDEYQRLWNRGMSLDLDTVTDNLIKHFTH